MSIPIFVVRKPGLFSKEELSYDPEPQGYTLHREAKDADLTLDRVIEFLDLDQKEKHGFGGTHRILADLLLLDVSRKKVTEAMQTIAFYGGLMSIHHNMDISPLDPSAPCLEEEAMKRCAHGEGLDQELKHLSQCILCSTAVEALNPYWEQA